MSDRLFKAMDVFYPLTDEIRQDLAAHMTFEHFAKHEMLVEHGKLNRKLYFIEQGLVRCFYYRKKRQKTDWFLREGHFIALAQSYYTKRPSTDGVEALEDCTVISLSFDILEELYQRHHILERNARYITMYYNFYWRQRYRETTRMPIIERYQELIDNLPDILQRAPLQYVASYLGTNKFHLSRIRAKRNN